MPIPESLRSRLPSAILFLAALFATAVVCALALTHRLPLGVPGEWEWGAVPAWSPSGLVTGGITTLSYAAFVALGYRVIQSDRGWVPVLLLAALVLAAVLVGMGIQQSAPSEYDLGRWPLVLYYRGPSGYYTAARTEVTSAGDFLAHYDEFQAKQDPFHLGTHPPGLILLHYAALRFCESNPGLSRALVGVEPAAVRQTFRSIRAHSVLPLADEASLWLVGLLAQFSAALTVLPLYAIARRVAPAASAWSAVCLWPLVPAVLIFMPKSDVMYPWIAAAAAALAVGVRAGRLGWLRLVLMGFVLCTGMFLTLGLASLLPLVALVIGREFLVERPRDAMGLGKAGLFAALGFLVPIAALAWASRHNLFVTWWHCYLKHASFYERMPRTYASWVWVDALEWLVALGIPLAVLAGAGLMSLSRARPTNRGEDAVRWLLWGWLVLVAVLDLSGKNRGEVARLWMFLMPYAVVAAALAFDRLRLGLPTVLFFLLLLAGQAVALLNSIEGFYDPHSIDLEPTSFRTRDSEQPSAASSWTVPRQAAPHPFPLPTRRASVARRVGRGAGVCHGSLESA